MNKAILLGRLTKDPELRYTQSQIPVASFSIAVDKGYAKAGEERKADFFNIVAWRGTAEFVSKYFTKGQRILVEGSIQNRTWDDNQGVRHYATEIVASNLFFADGKKDSGFSHNQMATPISEPPTQKSGNDDGFYGISEDDDDIPF